MDSLKKIMAMSAVMQLGSYEHAPVNRRKQCKFSVNHKCTKKLGNCDGYKNCKKKGY